MCASVFIKALRLSLSLSQACKVAKTEGKFVCMADFHFKGDVPLIAKEGCMPQETELYSRQHIKNARRRKSFLASSWQSFAQGGDITAVKNNIVELSDPIAFLCRQWRFSPGGDTRVSQVLWQEAACWRDFSVSQVAVLLSRKRQMRSARRVLARYEVPHRCVRLLLCANFLKLKLASLSYPSGAVIFLYTCCQNASPCSQKYNRSRFFFSVMRFLDVSVPFCTILNVVLISILHDSWRFSAVRAKFCSMLWWHDALWLWMLSRNHCILSSRRFFYIPSNFAGILLMHRRSFPDRIVTLFCAAATDQTSRPWSRQT